jgi:DNA repair exonuclease SbcCD ATPase subunit
MRANVEEAVTAAVAEERAKNSESLEQARKDVAEQRKIAAELSKGRALEKERHVNEIRDKDEKIREAVDALKAKAEECKQLEKDVENAEEAARRELLQERQTCENEMEELREAKVMLFFLSVQTLCDIFLNRRRW